MVAERRLSSSELSLSMLLMIINQNQVHAALVARLAVDALR